MDPPADAVFARMSTNGFQAVRARPSQRGPGDGNCRPAALSASAGPVRRRTSHMRGRPKRNIRFRTRLMAIPPTIQIPTVGRPAAPYFGRIPYTVESCRAKVDRLP